MILLFRIDEEPKIYRFNLLNLIAGKRDRIAFANLISESDKLHSDWASGFYPVNPD
jgi:hypothetical protein